MDHATKVAKEFELYGLSARKLTLQQTHLANSSAPYKGGVLLGYIDELINPFETVDSLIGTSRGVEFEPETTTVKSDTVRQDIYAATFNGKLGKIAREFANSKEYLRSKTDYSESGHLTHLVNGEPEAYPIEKLVRSNVEYLAVDAMATVLWADFWADKEEDRGVSFARMDIVDAAPTITEECIVLAGRIMGAWEAANAATFHEMYDRAIAANAGAGKEEPDMEQFAGYIALEAIGHGVSWFDRNPEFPMKFPAHCEFMPEESYNKWLEEEAGQSWTP